MENGEKRINHGSVLIEAYKNAFMDGQNYSSDNVGTVFIDDWKTKETRKRERERGIGPILES